MSPQVMNDDKMKDTKEKPLMTWEQVSKHNTQESCYIVIEGFVYDVTKWLDRHPGGSKVLTNMAGVDCTDVFNAYHTHEVRKSLKYYKIGKLDGYTVTPMVKEFRELAETIENSPLMKTRSSFYFKLYAWCAFLLASTITLVLNYKDNFWMGTVLSGVLMAVYFQQIAFIGHDMAHGSVCNDHQNAKYVPSARMTMPIRCACKV